MVDDTKFEICRHIPKHLKHLIWKDEVGDDTVLTSHMEIFMYSPDTIKVHVFNLRKIHDITKNCEIIRDEGLTDDGIWIAVLPLDSLEYLLSLGIGKRRPHIGGRHMKEMESLLAHKFIPYKPVKKYKDAA